MKFIDFIKQLIPKRSNSSKKGKLNPRDNAFQANLDTISVYSISEPTQATSLNKSNLAEKNIADGQRVTEQLKAIIDNIEPKQFTSMRLGELANKRELHLLDQEDIQIARELRILSKHLINAEKGTYNSNEQKIGLEFKFLNQPEFNNVISTLIKINQEVANKNAQKNTPEYLTKIIMEARDYEFNSGSLTFYASFFVEKNNCPEAGPVVTELRTLAKLFERAEKGKFKNADLAELNIFKSGECFDKIAKKLREKTTDVLAAEKEYQARQAEVEEAQTSNSDTKNSQYGTFFGTKDSNSTLPDQESDNSTEEIIQPKNENDIYLTLTSM